MTKGKIAKMLPIKPRLHMAEDVAKHCREELGPDFCLYRRVSSGQEVDYLGWPDFDFQQKAPRGWIAECKCGWCGETWHSGYRPGRGISMLIGEDGIPWAGVPAEDSSEQVPFDEGETLECPLCNTKVKLIQAQELRNGRTYRIAVGSVENAGPYTAVILWMAERFIHSDGTGSRALYPKAAAVIDESGKLMFFSYADGKWGPRRGTNDPFQVFYGTHGGVPNRTIGAWLWPDVPEQRGQTGEKTGLAEYFICGGRWPILYLRLWQGYPAIENLVKAGWLKPFEEAIDEEVMDHTQAELDRVSRRKHLVAPTAVLSLADWNAVKPHEMLGMTREEVRLGRGWHWTRDVLDLWIGMVSEGVMQPGVAALYDRCRRDYGMGAMRNWANAAVEARVPAPLEAIDRYLHRQHEKHGLPLQTALETYLDYICMLDEEHPTEVQIFPPDLLAAHDRAMVSAAAANNAKFVNGFGVIWSRWHELEWSDGSICAMLPRCNADLVIEGKKLNHCVGGYGKTHTEGKLIVFIRHTRRPERSWFTLNIDTTGKQWHEIQLHGYSNEWAHGKNLHIPKEVRAFVDRWEAEVLTPVFRRIKAAERRRSKKAVTAA